MHSRTLRFLGLCLVTACGNTSRNPQSSVRDVSAGGETDTGGQPSGADSGSANPPDVPYEAGAAGSAGDANQNEASFFLVPWLPPGPEIRDGKLAGVSNTAVAADQVSRDGSLILGTSRYKFNRKQFFYFTRETGTQPFNHATGHVCLTPDGAVVIGSDYAEPGAGGFFRWTKASGFELLPGDASIAQWYLPSCAADGSAALGIREHVDGSFAPLMWQQRGGRGQLLDIDLPGVTQFSNAFISADGSAVVVREYIEPERPGPGSGIHRWTTAGTAQLPLPLGYRECRPLHHMGPEQSLMANQDASQILVSCLSSTTFLRTVFRWTEGTNQLMPLVGAPDEPFWISKDFKQILGLDADQSLVKWEEGFPRAATMVPALNHHLSGASDDGSVVYVGNNPMRWTEGEGFVFLELLRGHGFGWISGYSSDGSVAIGFSWSDGGENHPVLWDVFGVRDIVTELEGAGVDLQNVQGLEPQRVWAGSPIVIQGRGYIENDVQFEQTWLAELPRRD